MHDLVAGQLQDPLHPPFNDPLIEVAAALVRNREIPFPAVHRDRVADDIAVLAWPTGAHGLHVGVTGFQVDGDLCGLGQIRKASGRHPLRGAIKEGDAVHNRKPFC